MIGVHKTKKRSKLQVSEPEPYLWKDFMSSVLGTASAAYSVTNNLGEITYK